IAEFEVGEHLLEPFPADEQTVPRTKDVLYRIVDHGHHGDDRVERDDQDNGQHQQPCAILLFTHAAALSLPSLPNSMATSPSKKRMKDLSNDRLTVSPGLGETSSSPRTSKRWPSASTVMMQSSPRWWTSATVPTMSASDAETMLMKSGRMPTCFRPCAE